MKTTTRHRGSSAISMAQFTALLLASGLGLIAVGAAGLAEQHAAQLGVICGRAATPHCAWCAVAVAAALAAGAALAAALAPSPRASARS